MIIIVLPLLVIIISLIVLWWREFIFMMALNDSDYRGKSDKILWFIVFLIFPLFAPFLFRSWKTVVKKSQV